MKALLSFASALADPLRLRILALVQAHRCSLGDLSSVLKESAESLSTQVKHLIEAGLLKADAKHTDIRVKKKAAKVINESFERFRVSAKSDASLRADARHAKQHREAARAAAKAFRKASRASKEKAKDKPKDKVAKVSKKPKPVAVKKK
ncbi:MAG: helix-turn-helix transcriptional regulator [Verrucomicrobiaceae bacterium]|nr:helix-turn-helix transcriptional regulator [Verrucomicrobiaceae bacterium]